MAILNDAPSRSPRPEGGEVRARKALRRAEMLDDPVFAGVSDAQGRLRVEVLQQAIQLIGEHSAQYLGPSLGVAAGFNSLDGD